MNNITISYSVSNSKDVFIYNENKDQLVNLTEEEALFVAESILKNINYQITLK